LEALGINPQGLIVQIINFTLLFVLLRLTVYKVLVGLIDKRNARIKESMDQAEAVRKQAAEAEENIKKQLDTARQEAQALINQAGQIRERLIEEARADARRQNETDLERARAAIQRERDDAIDQVRKEFAELTVLAAERVIHKSLDPATHRELIEEVLKESGNLQGGSR